MQFPYKRRNPRFSNLKHVQHAWSQTFPPSFTFSERTKQKMNQDGRNVCLWPNTWNYLLHKCCNADGLRAKRIIENLHNFTWLFSASCELIKIKNQKILIAYCEEFCSKWRQWMKLEFEFFNNWPFFFSQLSEFCTYGSWLVSKQIIMGVSKRLHIESKASFRCWDEMRNLNIVVK